MVRFASFSRCRSRAEAHCRRLRAAGHDAMVGYGGFRPDAPPATWDERWATLAADHPSVLETGFAHYWVEIGETIEDVSADQFGGPAGTFSVAAGDPRYRRLGSYSPSAR